MSDIHRDKSAERQELVPGCNIAQRAQVTISVRSSIAKLCAGSIVGIQILIRRDIILFSDVSHQPAFPGDPHWRFLGGASKLRSKEESKPRTQPRCLASPNLNGGFIP